MLRQLEGAMSQRFDAFISYTRRSPRDPVVAQALQRGLGKLAKRWYELRALRVFLDRSALAFEADLPAVLQEALRDSGRLILVCSPAAAAAPWVTRELD